ncbi:hypothetical protein PGTUg99_015150 [Puccinia graminis f. sp. tritici]|uniref:Uncharacterized protein n=1 Tax=Puccinia graminis f. sp. tritici TaxID=56615 RepID=A0A5B0N0D9_PUCGR|nr:hypothetical protein PGTUg99_015150 [Puccinia graminis f. sp. tritici]
MFPSSVLTSSQRQFPSPSQAFSCNSTPSRMFLHGGALVTLMVIISQSSARSPGNSVWKRAVLEEVTSPHLCFTAPDPASLSHSPSTAFREGSHVDRLMGMPFNGPKDSKDAMVETRDGPGAHTRVTRTPTTFNPVPQGKTISLKQFRIIAPRVTGINPVDIRRILRGFE